MVLTEKGCQAQEDLSMATQALQFLKQNRVSRIDASRHLTILLNAEAFSAVEIGENAMLLLKFVKLCERVNLEAERMRQSQDFNVNPPKSLIKGYKSSINNRGFDTMSHFTYDDNFQSGAASPTSSYHQIG